MVDEADGAAGGGPPSFPGTGSEGAPAVPPSMPSSMPPPMPPPSYPPPPTGGYPPPPPQPGYGSAPGMPGVAPYASWGLRLGGFLIDIVILGVVQAILDGVFFRHSSTLTVRMTMTNNGVVHHNTFSFLALIIGFVIDVAYATVLIGGPGGKTVGMMAVGVRCVRDETHEVVGYGKALGRSLVETVFRLTVIVGLLDDLWPLWDRKNQTLHDKVVSTVVIRTRNPG
jgi:uncharacterized RDD family membrane protein YckC